MDVQHCPAMEVVEEKKSCQNRVRVSAKGKTCSQPSRVDATVRSAQPVFLTFIKESNSQHQPIQCQGSNICGVNNQRDDPRQAKEEVHGGVLPVHYVFPVLLCRVVQLESWPISKLLGQNPWSAQHMLLIYTVS